jgi:hypothetical protein
LTKGKKEERKGRRTRRKGRKKEEKGGKWRCVRNKTNEGCNG